MNRLWLKQMLAAVITLVLTISFVPPTVFAITLPQDDINAINLDTVWHKTYQVCGAAGNDLMGSDNREKIWNYLTGPDKKLTPIKAASIMGNLQTESAGTWDPTIVQGGGHSDTIKIDGSTGYGIGQWTAINRQKNLLTFATKDGEPETNVSKLQVQLDFLYFETTEGSLRGAWDELIAQPEDVKTATWYWEDTFERPAVRHQQARVDNATAILTEFGSGTSSTRNSSTCHSNFSSGSYSLPVDKKFYDEHKNWFTKPHHDYPAADIPVPDGSEVFSVSGGTIITAPTSDACGNGIVVDAGDGVQFTYCHGSDGGAVNGARKGDQVTPGQLIMHTDSTGHVIPAGLKGTHLHLGIRIAGTSVCPQSFLVGIAENQVPDIKSLPTSGCTN